MVEKEKVVFYFWGARDTKCGSKHDKGWNFRRGFFGQRKGRGKRVLGRGAGEIKVFL